MADIEMPQLGETVTEGTITQWFKKVGDSVAEDEPLFEVSTDKVDSEVPSPVSGVVQEILVEEGETVDVGTKLAVVGDGTARPPTVARRPAAEAEASRAAEAAEPDARSRAGSRRPNPQPAAEPRRPRAPSPSAEPEPAPAPAPAATTPTAGQRAARPSCSRRSCAVSSPRTTSTVDQIAGTGAGGRITRNDVQQLIESGGGGQDGKGRGRAGRQSRRSVRAAARGSGRGAPAGRQGRRARHGQAAQQHPEADRRAHGPLEADLAPRAGWRSRSTSRRSTRSAAPPRTSSRRRRASASPTSRSSAGPRSRPSRSSPHVNATMGDGELILHNYVNLGIAVDLNFEGLIVPVVHDADGKRMRAIARDISDLAEPGPLEEAQPRRPGQRDLHHHQPRAVRHAHDRGDHQPTAGGDPVN